MNTCAHSMHSLMATSSLPNKTESSLTCYRPLNHRCISTTGFWFIPRMRWSLPRPRHWAIWSRVSPTSWPGWASTDLQARFRTSWAHSALQSCARTGPRHWEPPSVAQPNTRSVWALSTNSWYGLPRLWWWGWLCWLHPCGTSWSTWWHHRAWLASSWWCTGTPALVILTTSFLMSRSWYSRHLITDWNSGDKSFPKVICAMTFFSASLFSSRLLEFSASWSYCSSPRFAVSK